MKNYGQEAVERGIHDIIKYDGSVMTDSGGYQVLEYGKVDVTPEAMAAFELEQILQYLVRRKEKVRFGQDPYKEASMKNW